MATVNFAWVRTERFIRQWNRPDSVVEELRPHIVPLGPEAEEFILEMAKMPRRESSIASIFGMLYVGGCGGTFMPATKRLVPSLRFHNEQPLDEAVLIELEGVFCRWFCRKVRSWASDNYDKGGDVIVECFTDDEILAQFKTLDEVKAFCKLSKEREDDVRSEIF